MEPVFHRRFRAPLRHERAIGPGTYGLLQKSTCRRVHLSDARDGVLDPPLDVDPRALGGRSGGARLSSQSERARELRLEHRLLTTRLLDTAHIAVPCSVR